MGLPLGLALPVMVTILFLLIHLTSRRKLLESLGIPMDRSGVPGFLAWPLDYHNHFMHQVQQSKFKTLRTKTYGKYEGVRPVITTIDPKIIQSILVKNYKNFNNVFFFSDTVKVLIRIKVYA